MLNRQTQRQQPQLSSYMYSRNEQTVKKGTLITTKINVQWRDKPNMWHICRFLLYFLSENQDPRLNLGT